MNRIGAHEERIVSLERFGDVSDEINISVVIVTYNDNPELMRCVESLASQMASDVEVIILDNGGSGKFREQLKEYKVTYIRLNKNYAPSIGRNMGTYYARGNIICFMDDDAVADKRFIEAHRKAHESPHILAVRGKILPVTDAIYNYLVGHYDLGEEVCEMTINMEANCSFKRHILEKVDGFNDDLFGHEGDELSYRIFRASGDRKGMIYYPQAVIYHDYANSLSKYIKKQIRHLRAEETFDSMQDQGMKEFIKSYIPPQPMRIRRNLRFIQRAELFLIKLLKKSIRTYLIVTGYGKSKKYV